MPLPSPKLQAQDTGELAEVSVKATTVPGTTVAGVALKLAVPPVEVRFARTTRNPTLLE